MQMTFNKTIGKNTYTFIVEGNNLFELVQESQKLGFYDVYKCGLCSSDKLGLRSYVTKDDGYEYVKVSCGECGAQVTFGKSKEVKDTYFLRKNKDKLIAWEMPKTEGNK
jgi:DNA-directed RNA polymerase subunit RPC12/RpoP